MDAHDEAGVLSFEPTTARRAVEFKQIDENFLMKKNNPRRKSGGTSCATPRQKSA